MVKFIVLGHGRSGSTLLVLSLAEHHNILAFDELLHYDLEERRRQFFEFNNRYPDDGLKRYYMDGEDGAEFLREVVFYDRMRKEVLAVGFKIFYIHVRDEPNSKKAWDYLTGNKDIHIIHLMRRNVIESWVSLQVALMTGEWARLQGTKPKQQRLPPLKLNPQECEAYCNQVLVYSQWAKRAFREHPLLEVEYERDVCGRFSSMMHDIHDFLDVPRRDVQLVLEKQAQRSISEQISNYSEFKEYFHHTIYEDFLA